MRKGKERRRKEERRQKIISEKARWKSCRKTVSKRVDNAPTF